MADEEYRNMTGFLLKVNGIPVPKEAFDPAEAARLRLRR